MFRESSAIDSERTASGVRALYAKYSENEEWFTGTPDSVDRRIAQCKRIANAAKAASVRLAGRDAGIQYIALAQEMDGDRTALEGLRRDLLTASSDREAGYFGDGQENDWRDEGYYDDEDKAPKAKAEHRAEAPYKGKHRAEARFFIAEQGCDDLGELLIRAQRHAERVSSTLPARQSRTHVASFVEAVRYAAEEDGDEPCESCGAKKEDCRCEDCDHKDDKKHSHRIASLDDFSADLMYLE